MNFCFVEGDGGSSRRFTEFPNRWIGLATCTRGIIVVLVTVRVVLSANDVSALVDYDI